MTTLNSRRTGTNSNSMVLVNRLCFFSRPQAAKLRDLKFLFYILYWVCWINFRRKGFKKPIGGSMIQTFPSQADLFSLLILKQPSHFCTTNALLLFILCHSMIQTNVSRVAPDWGPLKDALPTELQCRGTHKLTLITTKPAPWPPFKYNVNHCTVPCTWVDFSVLQRHYQIKNPCWMFKNICNRIFSA